jgi:hypothetical protein
MIVFQLAELAGAENLAWKIAFRSTAMFFMQCSLLAGFREMLIIIGDIPD